MRLSRDSELVVEGALPIKCVADFADTRCLSWSRRPETLHVPVLSFLLAQMTVKFGL